MPNAYFPDTSQGLLIQDTVCYTTNELIKLKNDLFTHEMMFGSYMLFIGVILGIAITVAYPRVYEWATKRIE